MKRIIALVLSFVLIMAVACHIEAFAQGTTLTFGKTDGAVYTNEYLNLGCCLDGWHYLTAGEIAKMNSQGLDRLPDELESFVRENQSFILMFAESESKQQNVNIVVSYAPDAKELADILGMKAIVNSMYSQTVAGQISLGRKNPRVSVVSDSISGETVYGMDIIYEESGTDVYQRGIILVVRDYVVSITATGDSTKDLENIIHSFFYLSEGNAVNSIEENSSESKSIPTQKYFGKLRPISFEIPMEWLQQELSQQYNSLEAKFVDQESMLTMIQYACQDLVATQDLPESMRSLFRTESFSPDDIRESYEDTLSDLTVERTVIGDLDCFVVRGTYGFSLVCIVFVEEGYMHQLGLYEMEPARLAEHEKVLFDIASTIALPNPGKSEMPEDATTESGSSETVQSHSEDVNHTAGESEFGTVGATVIFGKYDQDDNMENGAEDIEWIVLDVQDGKCLLLSKFSLDTQSYYKGLGGSTWANSHLREWLNTKFAMAAFSEQEIDRILISHVPNDSSQVFAGRDGGDDTEDRIFLLSEYEADKYMGRTARQCAPTDTAIRHRAIPSDMCYSYGRGTSPWWLRSPGEWDHIMIVKYDGTFDNFQNADSSSVAVRPAMWVRLESDK